MQIRRAALTDIDAIEVLWREMMNFHIECDDYFTMSTEADTNHREYMTGLIQDENKRVYVADDDSQLIGYLMAEINAYPPIYLHQRFGHIGAISVSESAQCKGVGRQLLEAALAWFRENDLQRVECSVAVENPLSQGFWKKMGFRSFVETRVLEL